MRLFEMLLVLSCFALLVDLLFIKRSAKKIGLGLGIGSSVILLVQLFVEGYRWQLLLVYIMTALFILIVLFRHSEKMVNLKIGKFLKYSLSSLIVILLVVSTGLSVYLPVFNLPKLDGPEKVGTQTFHFTDQNRDEVLTEDQSDKRELMVQVWYPTENSNNNKREPLFPKDKEMFKKYIQTYSSSLNLPDFVFNYWKYSKTNSYENVEILPSTSPYPVVLLSHGMGTSRVLHASQAENLASHGFIVVTIDHTYSTFATIFPDGRVTDYITKMTKIDDRSKVGDIWTKDVEFVINQIENLNSGVIESQFKGKIDLNNMGVMGHSFGGATAFNTTYLDPRIKAGVNMDGSLYKVKNRDDINKPFMFIRSGSFKEWLVDFKKDKNSDDEITKQLSDELHIMKNVINQGGNVIYIEGTQHFNFTDLQFYSELIKLTGITGDINGKKGSSIVNQYVLDFFNKQLKGTGGNLIQGPNDMYPEVKFIEPEEL
ncbi:alpha/beta hydrolase family protein [Paenibacillus macquariensis]|uniref:Platelet-activating factor acetylhydrolase, isoform II n=1 Tax=Paenibacillus macquariensis TaxID=948756 RepID=A0ABY1JN74_9BACL|nr:Platelet-activating factor acetylhydrolase plasma/intracellular isoform II [Paenibacillus macquariensis]MEC0092192.1 Platelet-activating factor acetylhydrolase plasma/intracellular isoform II [Paenibacillus macquariensis]OAB37259.1 Platelet-activating factor acetylhydrolase plasma/intracellular isoform II [Paenibacillus macquariensis subsp. macquariensis]SIQ49273.1 Platelet-activating factor acetylhydrolase, isoform II [Paenibacillus macquariensis]